MVSLRGHAKVICQFDVWYFGTNSESDADFSHLIILRSKLKQGSYLFYIPLFIKLIH